MSLGAQAQAAAAHAFGSGVSTEMAALTFADLGPDPSEADTVKHVHTSLQNQGPGPFTCKGLIAAKPPATLQTKHSAPCGVRPLCWLGFESGSCEADCSCSVT